MTNELIRSAPRFRMRSHLSATIRALGVVALCAAITAVFLAQVWSAPQPQGPGDAAKAAVGVTRNSRARPSRCASPSSEA